MLIVAKLMRKDKRRFLFVHILAADYHGIKASDKHCAASVSERRELFLAYSKLFGGKEVGFGHFLIYAKLRIFEHSFLYTDVNNGIERHAQHCSGGIHCKNKRVQPFRAAYGFVSDDDVLADCHGSVVRFIFALALFKRPLRFFGRDNDVWVFLQGLLFLVACKLVSDIVRQRIHYLPSRRYQIVDRYPAFWEYWADKACEKNHPHNHTDSGRNSALEYLFYCDND